MKKWFESNLLLKIISLALAVITWLYVQLLLHGSISKVVDLWRN